MPRYLLDTNALSDLMKNPHGPVAAKLRALSSSDPYCTSILVAAELRYGAAKKGSPVLSARVEQLLQAIEVLPFNNDADRHYGQLRADLERRGTLIGGNDMLIAAHALAANCVLVTANVQEFSRVRGLKVENWEAPPQRLRR
jgi:tRNA(fMet)-specific endonuclease VapC